MIPLDLEYKYELFFELSPDLLCIAGFDGYFKKINSSVSKLLGYSMEELYSRPINDFVFHEDKELTGKVRHELTRSKPLYNFENRYVTKEGKIVWLSWTSLPVNSDKLIFAIAKNITHKKVIEAEKNMLISDIVQMNKDLKQLTYATSHDLRSPVNNLISLFGLLDHSRVSDHETTELLAYLKKATGKLKSTLDGYVDRLSEKHTSHSKTELIFFNEVLQEVTTNLNALIQLTQTSITTDFLAADQISFNRAHLHSTFLNLFSNSIKYAKPDTLPRIDIRTEKNSGFVKLIFSDNGRGFDMETVRDRLFGLHQKFHDYADSKGIGLYLIHNYITAAGGSIEVESRVNEGAKFIITFRDQS